MTTDIPASVTTPNSVATSIGTLTFFDGVPTDETVRTVSDNLDLMRGVDEFLNLLPGVSMYGLREGNRAQGADQAIVWQPREAAARVYPDSDSAWVMAYAGKDVFFEKDGASNLDARTMFHYAYTVITPAIATPHVGKGSDDGIAYLDADKKAMEGAKTYKLTIPANPPVADLWAVTLYDSQTRSMLQIDQQFPTVGSQSDGFEQNADGSYDVYFAPDAPKGKENNWRQTIPGKSWFTILRIYGPLQPWIDRTWRPGEIEPQG